MDCARGGDLVKLLGEKRDVRAWLSWLERYAHGEVEAIETPIGFIPRYEDLPRFVQASASIRGRSTTSSSPFTWTTSWRGSSLQEEAYRKEKKMPARLFEVYEEQKKGSWR